MVNFAVNLTIERCLENLACHTPGCVCEGVSRNDCHVGQETAWERPALNMDSTTQWLGAQMEQKVEKEGT